MEIEKLKTPPKKFAIQRSKYRLLSRKNTIKSICKDRKFNKFSKFSVVHHIDNIYENTPIQQNFEILLFYLSHLRNVN